MNTTKTMSNETITIHAKALAACNAAREREKEARARSWPLMFRAVVPGATRRDKALARAAMQITAVLTEAAIAWEATEWAARKAMSAEEEAARLQETNRHKAALSAQWAAFRRE